MSITHLNTPFAKKRGKDNRKYKEHISCVHNHRIINMSQGIIVRSLVIPFDPVLKLGHKKLLTFFFALRVKLHFFLRL